MSPPPGSVSGTVFPRLLVAAAAVVVVALAAPRCTSDRSADGAPCTSPFNCASGFCLARSATVSVCAHVCTTDGDCLPGDLCGIFDLRGLDDAGLPSGDPSDVVHVCRPTTRQSCTAGCGMANCLSLGAPADGVCAQRCHADGDCTNNVCLRAPGACDGLCAPTCDSLAECPRYFVCDLAHIDGAGHGRCVPVDPDAGVAQGAAADAACGVDP